MKEDFATALRDLLSEDPAVMAVLSAVRSLGAPDCWVAAGFVRNRVWDHLHGYDQPTPPADIDVIYFDAGDLDEAVEKRMEAALHARLPGLPWSVKNQARMAGVNDDRPYRDARHALEHWCETPTTVAIRLSADDKIEIDAPFGFDDLFGLIARPTPFARGKPEKLAQYRERMIKKNWPRRWPKVRVLDL